MKQLISRLMVVVLLTMVMGPPAMGGDSETERATLKGIGGVHVLIESFSEDEESAGFDTRTFQTDVELKLRLAGIKVLTETERLATPGSPLLQLIIEPLDPERGTSSPFAIILELKQGVRLGRDPNTWTGAATWSTGSVGNGGIPFIRENVKDHVDQFINAWLSVNK